jgi:hypothetical protein
VRIRPVGTATDGRPPPSSKSISRASGRRPGVTLPNLQKFKKIETLAVVEAMKVRNVLRAQRDGAVTKIHASAGATLAVDALSVSLARFASEGWWACLDSNQEPDRYERPALTIELQAPPRAAVWCGRQRCWRPLTMRLASRQCRVYFGISEIPLDAGVETEIYRFGPASSRGAFRDRHGRGRRDAVDAGGASDEGAGLRTAKSCGPDAPTLASSRRRQLRRRRWQTSPVTGESAI